MIVVACFINSFMKNKVTAVFDVLNYVVNPRMATKFFYNVYEFILYNDTDGFLNVLDYRMGLGIEKKPAEDYFIFTYMLRYLQAHHPNKISMLSPKLPLAFIPDTTRKEPANLPDYSFLFSEAGLAA
jgi:hypothetical protein